MAVELAVGLMAVLAARQQVGFEVVGLAVGLAVGLVV